MTHRLRAQSASSDTGDWVDNEDMVPVLGRVWVAPAAHRPHRALPNRSMTTADTAFSGFVPPPARAPMVTWERPGLRAGSVGTFLRMAARDGRVQVDKFGAYSYVLRFMVDDRKEPFTPLTVRIDVATGDIVVRHIGDQRAEGVPGPDTLALLRAGLAHIPDLPLFGNVLFEDGGSMPTHMVVADDAGGFAGGRRRGQRALTFA